jgi:hypothetical protein
MLVTVTPGEGGGNYSILKPLPLAIISKVTIYIYKCMLRSLQTHCSVLLLHRRCRTYHELYTSLKFVAYSAIQTCWGYTDYIECVLYAASRKRNSL